MLSLDRPEQLVKTLSSYYDRDWLTWAPEVTSSVLEKNFGLSLSDQERDLVEVLKEAIRSDRVFRDPFLFEKLSRLLGGEPVSVSYWDGAEPGHVALALSLLPRITGRSFAAPPAGKENEKAIEQDVFRKIERPSRAYAAAILFDEGLFVAPESLPIGVLKEEIATLSPAVEEADRQLIVRTFDELVLPHLPEDGSLTKDAEGALRRARTALLKTFHEARSVSAEEAVRQIAILAGLTLYLRRRQR